MTLNEVQVAEPIKEVGMRLIGQFIRTVALIAGLMGPFSWLSSQGLAQQVANGKTPSPGLSLDTEAVAPQRFIAAHGRRALVDGYASDSLEIWAYPFQILSGYRIAFHTPGSATAINGQEISSRVHYEPNSITRIYVGPDYIVHEKLFVPLDFPGAILTYSIESQHPVEIEVHAVPVLNLMWPAALGGQSVAWNPSLSAFILSESSDGYSAVFGSPQIIAHDDAGNRTSHGVADSGIGFTIHPDSSGNASVFVALNHPHDEPGLLFHKLVQGQQALEAEADAHQSAYEDQMLRVETPDLRVNQAIAWAETALDQAWVCNPDLGCGFVAGYGPSRGPRRPQYDWFFAGDGLIAATAANSIGDREHARQEFEFILHYQDARTGMIWHELSQSAGFLDWTGKYPYMFVHVDITFQFMDALEEYVSTTGDIDFMRKNWPAIKFAYEYCNSIIDPSTGLPRIPADKEGGNEQDRMSDDLGLSASWVEAASAFAHFATLTGHSDLAKEAESASQRARAAIPTHYWSDQQSFWISGHTSSGQAMAERRSSPTEALNMHLFSPEQTSLVMDQIASSSFQTDWGTRGIGQGSAGFDAESYAKGSISALHTAGVAQAFWSEHRPVTALALWRSLLPWTSLDSMGHMHEVLAGNYYRAQVESVPEQTWSSAGYLEATIHGLLGLHVDSVARRLVFAPHLPAEWNNISIQHLRVAEVTGISLILHRTTSGLTLQIDNPGDTFQFEFIPEIPLGASLGQAFLNQQQIEAKLVKHPQESDADMLFAVPRGKSEVRLNLQGGVSLIVPQPEPLLGEADNGIHIIDTHLEEHTLTVLADVPSNNDSHLQIRTALQVGSAEGVIAKAIDAEAIELTFAASHNAIHSYRRVHAVVHFDP